jgi:uncharacterized membrane protein YhiD involved in acid resistance
MDELTSQLDKFKDLSNVFTIWDVAIVFSLSLVLCMVLGWVYRATHKGVSYSQGFVHTLVIMGVTVAFIMLIIGSNIARAFTMVGALSIVRFRNAVKESRDMGFVFVTMAVGMACGTRFYLLAVFATVGVSCAIFAMSALNLFSKQVRERILMVRIPHDLDFLLTFEDLFRKRLSEYHIISMESVRQETLQEVLCSVVLKRGVDPASFIEEIRQHNGGNKVSLILGQQEVDL